MSNLNKLTMYKEGLHNLEMKGYDVAEANRLLTLCIDATIGGDVKGADYYISKIETFDFELMKQPAIVQMELI